MTGGWETQLGRVRRWHVRAVKAESPTDRLDFLYAFFESAFHLGDWLLDTGAVSRAALDALFAANVEMRLCRDLANAHKHYSLRNKPRQPRPPAEALEYAPSRGTVTANTSLTILSDGEQYEAFALARRILDVWEHFIDTRVRADVGEHSSRL